jgi:endonuclease/exonuclease/phosphatase family metal-dependent hydrolase
MKIISWNILHIMHEYNHVGNESLVISKYPNENERMRLIIEKIENFLNQEEQVIILLQEVPMDYLLEMKNKLINVNFLNHSYSYLPRCNKPIYQNPQENLVIILKNVAYKNYQVIELEKGGKSAQKIELDNFIVYNVHMPFGNEKLKASLNLLNLNTNQSLIIGGDFNDSPKYLERNLSPYQCNLKLNETITHQTINKGTIKDKIYDHFVFKNLDLKNNKLTVDKTDLSDHYPIVLEL